jgi:hypothetical protein
MKKARIILLCMLVLGTVGGIVAFKAKRTTPICYSFPVNGSCTNPSGCTYTWTIRTTPVGTPVCYTLYTSNCTFLCTSIIRVTIE